MTKSKLIGSAGAVMLSCAAVFGDVVLVQNGKPEAEIVLSKPATKSAQLGAFELQHHIRLITGAELPILTGKASGKAKTVIRIGGENQSIKEEASVIKFRPGEILLTGGDTADYGKVDYKRSGTYPSVNYHWKGSLFAVYDFLEDYCGVRFYGIDPLDTTYTKRSTLSVKEKDRYFASKMDAFRDIYDDLFHTGHKIKKTRRDHDLWKLRWRSSVTYAKTNHNTYSIYFTHWDKAKDRYLADSFKGKRPEMFAHGYAGKAATAGPFLEKRFPGDLNLPPQLCYSNPGTIEYYAREALTYYHGKNVRGGWMNIAGVVSPEKNLMPRFPGKPYYYPYEGNDSGMFCKCPLCQKFASAGNFSYTKFRFAGDIAAKIKELEPGAKVGISTLAYGETLPFPEKLGIPDGVSSELCLVNYAWWHPGIYRRNLENLHKWGKAMKAKKAPLTLWLYVYGPGHDSRTHYGRYKTFPLFYPWKAAEHVKEFVKAGVKGIFSECEMPENYLEAYVILKLAYDSSLNSDQIIDEFFNRYYGAAGPSMKKFYKIIQDAAWAPGFTPKEWYKNPKQPLGPGGRGISPWWPTKLWDRDMNWKLGSPERIAQLQKLIDQAQKLVKTPEEKERLKRFIDATWKPALQGRREYELYIKQKQVPPRSITLSPVPDGANGDPQKADWSKAETTEKWLGFDGKDIGSTASVKALIDSKYLYLKFEENRQPWLDNGIWTENVEFFFTADGNYPLYHFAHSPQKGSKPTGIILQNINDVMRAGEYDFQARTVSVPTDKSWTLYMAIPRARLPLKDNTMLLDFFRMRHDGKKWHVSCWQPTYTIAGKNGMDSFGKLFVLPFTVQDKDFKLLWKGSGTGLVKDPEATDGSAAYQEGKLSWYLSYPIPKAFPKKKVDIILRVRLEAARADTLSCGVHDWKKKKRVCGRSIPAKGINGKKYGEFKIGSAVLNSDMSIYIGSIYFQKKWLKDNRDRTFLDCIRFEEAK